MTSVARIEWEIETLTLIKSFIVSQQAIELVEETIEILTEEKTRKLGK